MNRKLIGEDDASQLIQLIERNGERIKRYFPNTLKEVADAKAIRERLKKNTSAEAKPQQYLFGIYDGPQLIGYLNVKNIDWDIPKCEFGYFIDRAYEGRGIMSHQIAATLDFCFDELQMEKVYLRIAPENVGSHRVAEKNGFLQEGLLRNEFRVETGELVDVVYYGKLRE